MERTIKLRIDGSYLRRSSDFGGVTGEGNATRLHLSFDGSWEGLTKSVTFYNARGENPVKLILTIEEITDNAGLEYELPIPKEPLAYEGVMTYVIDGWIAGRRQRSVCGELEVRYAPPGEGEDSTDPTPSQAEQLQSEIDGMLGAFIEYRDDAAQSAQSASESAEAAQAASEGVEIYATAAQAGAQAAQQAQAAAEAAQAGAAQSEAATGAYSTLAESWAAGGTGTRAGEDEDNSRYYSNRAGSFSSAAESARESAQTANSAAQAAMQDAQASSATAQDAADIASDGAASASIDAVSAAQSAASAGISAGNAAISESNALSEANRAKSEADRAQQIVGGDFATHSEAQGYVNTHDAAGGAHAALFAQRATTTALNAHTGNSGIHVTAQEKAAWNAKQSALTFDSTPRPGSTNPVTSGGIKAAIDDVAQDVHNLSRFKGYVLLISDLANIENVTENDFAWVAEFEAPDTGPTVWTYSEGEWANTHEPVPENASPLSDLTPLGTTTGGSPGTLEEAARGDHQHPKETVSAADVDISDETETALWGDAADRTVDDALGLMGQKYFGAGKYSWARYLYDEPYVTHTTSSYSLTPSGTIGTLSATILYSSLIKSTPNRSGGMRLELVSPSAVQITNSTAGETAAQVLRGKYIAGDSPSGIIEIPMSATITNDGNGGWHILASHANFLRVYGGVRGGATYLLGLDSDAYPEGVTGGYYYVKTGAINDLISGDVSRYETGSYIGTGTYGSSNQNTLKTLGDINLLVVYEKNGGRIFFAAPGMARNCGLETNTTITGSPYSHTSWLTWISEREVTWYAGDARAQFNASGTEYGYVVLR